MIQVKVELWEFGLRNHAGLWFDNAMAYGTNPVQGDTTLP